MRLINIFPQVYRSEESGVSLSLWSAFFFISTLFATPSSCCSSCPLRSLLCAFNFSVCLSRCPRPSLYTVIITIRSLSALLSWEERWVPLCIVGGRKGAANSTTSLNNKGCQSPPPSRGNNWFLTAAKLASVAPLAALPSYTQWSFTAPVSHRAEQSLWSRLMWTKPWGQLENIFGHYLAFSIEILTWDYKLLLTSFHDVIMVSLDTLAVLNSCDRLWKTILWQKHNNAIFHLSKNNNSHKLGLTEKKKKKNLCSHSVENSCLGCQDLLWEPGRSKLRPLRFPALTDGHGTARPTASWPERASLMCDAPGRRLQRA